MLHDIVPPIQSFMTPDPCVIDETLSLTDAMDRMIANNIRHLIIVRGGQAVGVIDAADLALASELDEHSANKVSLEQAARPLYQCPPNMPLTDVVRAMESKHLTCAVIVDRGHVVGIFTLTDALRAIRQIAMGHPVEPQTVPTHRPDLPAEREMVTPRTRARQVVDRRGATPSAGDGLVFGSVGV